LTSCPKNPGSPDGQEFIEAAANDIEEESSERREIQIANQSLDQTPLFPT
jgi:hypothetical protein